MSDRTTLLFALPDFRVLDVTLEPEGAVRSSWKALQSRAAVRPVACSRG